MDVWLTRLLFLNGAQLVSTSHEMDVVFDGGCTNGVCTDGGLCNILSF